MKNYFLQVDAPNSHCLMVCGVTGAGKRSFIQAFLAQASFSMLKQATRLKVSEISVIVLLDGVHSNNLDEENLLKELAHWRGLNSHVHCRFLFLLNKLDLFVGKNDFTALCVSMKREYESMTALYKMECNHFALTSMKCIKLLNEVLQGHDIDEVLASDLKRTFRNVAPDHIKKHHTHAHIQEIVLHNINVFLDRIGANEITSFLSPIFWKNVKSTECEEKR